MKGYRRVYIGVYVSEHCGKKGDAGKKGKGYVPAYNAPVKDKERPYEYCQVAYRSHKARLLSEKQGGEVVGIEDAWIHLNAIRGVSIPVVEWGSKKRLILSGQDSLNTTQATSTGLKG